MEISVILDLIKEKFNISFEENGEVIKEIKEAMQDAIENCKKDKLDTSSLDKKNISPIILQYFLKHSRFRLDISIKEIDLCMGVEAKERRARLQQYISKIDYLTNLFPLI